MIVELISDYGSVSVETVPERTVDGLLWKLTDLKRYFSSKMRNDIEEMPDADGGFDPDQTYRRPKSMTLEGIISASSSEVAVASGYLHLNGLDPFGRGLTLRVTDPTGVYDFAVRLDDVDVVPFTDRRARFQVGVTAVDPRKYGPADTVTVGPAGTSEDGLIFPLFGAVDTGTLDFGAFSPSGRVTITNDGKAPSWPSFVIRGQIDSDGFQIVSDANVIEFLGAVPGGAELSLSPYAGGRAVMSNVDVTGEFLTRSEWSVVAPGESRSYSFIPLGDTDENAQMTVQFRKAWW